MTANIPMHTFARGGQTPLPLRFTLGLDLGKVTDYTALAIAEERPERCIEQFNQATVTPVWGDDPDYDVGLVSPTHSDCCCSLGK